VLVWMRRHPCDWREFRRWKMAMGKIRTFVLPSSVASSTSFAKFCATTCAKSCATFHVAA